MLLSRFLGLLAGSGSFLGSRGDLFRAFQISLGSRERFRCILLDLGAICLDLFEKAHTLDDVNGVPADVDCRTASPYARTDLHDSYVVA